MAGFVCLLRTVENPSIELIDFIPDHIRLLAMFSLTRLLDFREKWTNARKELFKTLSAKLLQKMSK